MTDAYRTSVAAALHDLLQTTWQYAYTGQRLQTWDDCPAQPALYTIVGDEEIRARSGMPAISILDFSVVVYTNTGRDTTVERPASVVDQIVEAILRLFVDDGPSGRVTLGGLVDHAWVEGRVVRDNGDLDGQAMLIVPIRVMLP